MNRSLLVCGFLVSSVCALGAHASRVNLGAAVGSASIDAGVIHGYYVAPTTVSDSSVSVRVFGSFDVNKYLALDASFQVFGETDRSLRIRDSAPTEPGHYSNDFKLNARTLTLGATFSYPLTDRWSLRAGGGGALTYSSAELSGWRYGDFKDESSGVLGFEAHAGLAARVTDRVSLELRGSRLAFGTKMGTTDDASATVVELSVAFRL